METDDIPDKASDGGATAHSLPRLVRTPASLAAASRLTCNKRKQIDQDGVEAIEEAVNMSGKGGEGCARLGDKKCEACVFGGWRCVPRGEATGILPKGG